MEFFVFSIIILSLLFIIIWISSLKNDIVSLSIKVKSLSKKIDLLQENSFVASSHKGESEIKPEQESESVCLNETVVEIPHDSIPDDYRTEISTTVEDYSQELYETPVFSSNDVINDIIEQDIGNSDNEIETTYITPKKSNNNFEKIFMGNIFNKIGAIAILISVCIFIKIISQYIIFTNEMKMILSFIAGFLMIVGAFKIQQDKKMQIFSEVLMGTGFGTILITTYCGAGFLKVFSSSVALIIACLITLAIYFIADKQKTTSTIVIGLIGGYLTPFFVNHNITMNFLFNYFIFLNIISLVFVYRNRQKEVINVTNLSLTSLCLLIFSCFSDKFSIIQVLILWGAYVLYDLLTIKNQRSKLAAGLSYINFAILTIMTLILISDYKTLGLIILGYSCIYFYLGLYYNSKLEIKENSYIYSGLISLFIATLFITNNNNLACIICWTIESLVISMLALKYSIKKIFYAASVFFIFAVYNVFLSSEIYKDYLYPIFNSRALYFLPVITVGSVISLLTKKAKQLTDSDIYKLLSISLGYTFLFFEVNSICKSYMETNILFEYIGITILFIFACNLKYLASNLKLKTIFSTVSALIFALGLTLLFIKDIGTFFTNTTSISLPILNMRSIAYLFSGFTLYYNYKIDKSDWQKYLAIVLGFSYIHFETVNIISIISTYNFEWLISVMWILYAGVISIIGIYKNKDFMKISGIWLSLLVVGRIFIYDLANLEMIYKLIAFIMLGSVLMIISYFYNKKIK